MTMLSPGPDCSLCGLCEGRTNIVLPSGDLNSNVVLVGEAPGENEDLSGKPFVGRAGRILDGILEAEGVDRSRIMITNTVKCRPPENREPTETEMQACRPFLDSELKGREVIVLLGKSAIKDLLGYTGPMKDIVNRTQTTEIDGEKVTFLPTYHPMACVYRKEAREGLALTIRTVKGMMG